MNLKFFTFYFLPYLPEISGVQSSLFLTLTSAPFFSNKTTTDTWPSDEAIYKNMIQ
jgi:hypothetical protein